MFKSVSLVSALVLTVLTINQAQATTLKEATVEAKITLAKKSTTKPMSIAYVPFVSKYYVADGGLGAINGEHGLILSASQIHVYSDKGELVQSVSPGLDNRSIYFNDATRQLETITYNISTEAGFGPNVGIFKLEMNETGELKEDSKDLFGTNPAFGTASAIPSFDPDSKLYYAKQPRGNKVWVIDLDKREKTAEISLDLTSAGAKFDDVTDYHVAYTGVKGEELAILDVEHKAVLVFDKQGKYVAKSVLPESLKLRSQNYISGLGYTNGLFFVYTEKEGEFGTFYGYKISDQAR